MKKKPEPKPDEGWKMLKTFNGLKLNDQEKRQLWPAVKSLYVYTDEKGRDTPKGSRADLGTFIKQAVFQKVERDQATAAASAAAAEASAKKPAAKRSLTNRRRKV